MNTVRYKTYRLIDSTTSTPLTVKVAWGVFQVEVTNRIIVCHKCPESKGPFMTEPVWIECKENRQWKRFIWCSLCERDAPKWVRSFINLVC